VVSLEDVHAKAGGVPMSSQKVPHGGAFGIAREPHGEARAVRSNEFQSHAPVVRGSYVRRREDVEPRPAAQAQRTDRASITTGVVRRAQFHLVSIHAGMDRVSELPDHDPAGRITVLVERADRDIMLGSEELSESSMVIGMSMREDKGIDGVAFQAFFLDQVTHPGEALASVNKEASSAVLDPDRIPLTDIHDLDHEGGK
jgi:hypothetical protein